MKSLFMLRLVSLGVGAAANIAFLTVLSATLAPSQFGVVAVATNLILVVQLVDLGWAGLAANLAGRGAQGSGLRGLYLKLATGLTGLAMSLSGGSVVLVLWAIGQLQLDLATHLWPIGLGLGVGVASAVLRIQLAILMGAGRVTAYYVCGLMQPLLLLLLMPIFVSSDSALLPTAAFGVAACGPGLMASLLVRRQSIPVPERMAATTFWAWAGDHVHEAVPLGIRQVSGALTLTGIPLLVGLLAGPNEVAELAVPHRSFLAAWSVIAVLHTANWGRMASLVAQSRVEVESLRTQLNRSAVILSLPLVVGILTLTWAVEAFAGPGVAPSLVASLLLCATLLIRCCYLGDSLVLLTSYGGYRVSSIQLAMALMGIALWLVSSVLLRAISPVIASGLLMLLYALADMLVNRRNVARARTAWTEI